MIQFGVLILVAFLIARWASASIPCLGMGGLCTGTTSDSGEHRGGPTTPIPPDPYQRGCCQVGPTELATQSRVAQSAQNERSVQVVVETPPGWLGSSDSFGMRLSQDSVSPPLSNPSNLSTAHSAPNFSQIITCFQLVDAMCFGECQFEFRSKQAHERTNQVSEFHREERSRFHWISWGSFLLGLVESYGSAGT
jgi:hypothetical protein